MELRVLQYFVTAAHEKSITEAGKLLHVTQPTISRQIINLEYELGTPLFVRAHRQLELTEKGKQFYPKAIEILKLCETTKQELFSC